MHQKRSQFRTFRKFPKIQSTRKVLLAPITNKLVHLLRIFSLKAIIATMSTSIAIPGFVSERKNEILELTKLGSQRREVSKKRQRITMYRTRSYISYSMSRAARQKHKKRPLLFAIKVKPKILYRQHQRIPRLLLNSFASMTTTEDNNTSSCIQSFDKKKKKKIEIGTSLTTTQSNNHFNRLNTHIWHVKRFFMMKKYGWRIPTHNRSKGLKSIDNLLNQCVLEDISYYLAGKNVSLEDDSSTVPPPAAVACSSMSLLGSIEAISDLLYEFMVSTQHLLYCVCILCMYIYCVFIYIMYVYILLLMLDIIYFVLLFYLLRLNSTIQYNTYIPYY